MPVDPNDRSWVKTGAEGFGATLGAGGDFVTELGPGAAAGIAAGVEGAAGETALDGPGDGGVAAMDGAAWVGTVGACRLTGCSNAPDGDRDFCEG